MSPVVEEIRLSLPHIELAAHIFGPEDGVPVWQTRTQVGRAERQTPLLKSRVNRLTHAA